MQQPTMVGPEAAAHIATVGGGNEIQTVGNSMQAAGMSEVATTVTAQVHQF